jgi:site-specific DNA recombinase
MKAVIYCRVSSKEQVQNYSLASQEKACREYCGRNGIAVDRVFVEEGESAKTANRTQFTLMLNYCRENKKSLDYLLVYAVDRFARNSLDHHTTTAFLARLGIELRSATQPIDKTAMGEFTESLSAALAQLDNRMRRDRTIDGMKAAVAAGRFPFKGALGYRNVASTGSQPNLVRDEQIAPFIEQAFELYGNTNQSAQEILRKLNALGFKTQTGKPVSAQSFAMTLRNPIYIGIIFVPKFGLKSKGSFQPIIAPELFARVQMKLSGKSATSVPHRKVNPLFPLRVFVRCAYCSTPLTGSTAKKKYAYYFCRNRSCRKLTVSKEKMECEFVALLLRCQLDPTYLKLLTAIVMDVWKLRAEHARQSLSMATKKLSELSERKNLVVEALLYRRISQDVYDDQMDRLEQELVLAEMVQHDARLDELEIEAVLAFAKHVLGNIARLWMDAGVESRLRLQRVVFPDGLTYSAEAGFGTPISSSFFNLSEEFGCMDSSLVSPMGFEPMLSP